MSHEDPLAADLGGCEYFGIPDPMPLCPLGDPDGDRTMVLVGDSHMRHWIPALSKIAKKQHYQAYFFVLQGCTPALVQPVTPLKDAPDEDCVFFHEWTQEQIEELRPDLVFMSTDTQFEYVDDEGNRTKDNKEIAALIERGMVDRIEATKPYAGRIVVIGDVPRLKFDPEVITERGATLEDGLSDPQARSMQMRRAVKAAVDTTGVDYVDPKPWFCAFDKCPVVVGDFVTHRDRGHMTLEYGRSCPSPWPGPWGSADRRVALVVPRPGCEPAPARQVREQRDRGHGSDGDRRPVGPHDPGAAHGRRHQQQLDPDPHRTRDRPAAEVLVAGDAVDAGQPQQDDQHDHGQRPVHARGRPRSGDPGGHLDEEPGDRADRVVDGVRVTGHAGILAYRFDAFPAGCEGGGMTNEDLKAKMREALDKKNTKEKGVHQDGPRARRRPTAPRWSAGRRRCTGARPVAGAREITHADCG